MYRQGLKFLVNMTGSCEGTSQSSSQAATCY